MMLKVDLKLRKKLFEGIMKALMIPRSLFPVRDGTVLEKGPSKLPKRAVWPASSCLDFDRTYGCDMRLI